MSKTQIRLIRSQSDLPLDHSPDLLPLEANRFDFGHIISPTYLTKNI